ncbi:DUF3618 domain-containing protein [Streptomyces sp. TX20-6-3]|uniref:DUF3618 domain-containing protein n=1 Tax=Streptomyces sp. TX20-6-3 TaxID=3028705 RepID=UPI0029A00C4E|nr:DUF3618 domain-containing protein [Streptomyces sp. TX20-6-3]MDX2564450.1 DUF3618 domain-containing protein [Streptomyces sp. TX20-6-3]
MGTTPEELRTDVEHRRAHLARSVDLLADRLTPRKMAQRKAASVRHGLTDMKERVMGTAHDTEHRVADSAGRTGDGLAESARQAAGKMSETVQDAPALVKRETQGSPPAAGIMAFGAGMLAAALLPTSKAEERAGENLKEHSGEQVEPVKQTAVDAAQEVKENLCEPVADAVGSVKSTAQEAGAATGEEVRATGQEEVRDVRGVAQDTATELRSTSGK